MPSKPSTAEGYAGGTRSLVEATCLYVATKLGDLMEDLVVVGGLVPSLIVAQDKLPPGAETHVGTMDLDIGLAVALITEHRYDTLTRRLRGAGFAPDTNGVGNATRQRWQIDGPPKVAVDFLIAPTRSDEQPGRLKNIEADFAALIAPGLPLAFRDRRKVVLTGPTLRGEQATRDVWVCGPAAFTVLKALAFRNRGENKDAYDLFYVVRNFGEGPVEVARALVPLLDAPEAAEAIAILQRDFTAVDGLGPRRVATFMTGAPDENIQADVVGFVADLLRQINRLSSGE